jgi:hypothetical protein
MSIGAGFAGCNTVQDGDVDGTHSREPTSTVTQTTVLAPTDSTDVETTDGTTMPTETPTAATSTETATRTGTPTVAEAVGTPALTPGSEWRSGEFGRAVALSDGTAIVGTEHRGAYVFEAGDTWARTAVLMPDGVDELGGYNVSVELIGDVALVGDPSGSPDPRNGAVYLFERVDDEWTERERFGTDEDTDEFGTSLAFDGDRVVVGDVHDPETMVPWTGDVFVFGGSATGWGREAKLGTDAENLFGTSVAVDDGTVLVGAPFAEPAEERTGAVYVYEFENGDPQRRMLPLPASVGEGGLFGQSVAFDGDTVVVGAPGTRQSSGTAYVFERLAGDWIQRASIPAPDGDATGDFGQSVALAGGVAVVGAPASSETGRAYVVRASDGWTDALRLVAADPAESADFGTSVALSGTTALVGAPAFDGTSAAYLFAL